MSVGSVDLNLHPGLILQTQQEINLQDFKGS